MDDGKLFNFGNNGYSMKDIYNLPDGKRAELIDGQIFYMAPPSFTHQKISRKLHQAIANYIDSKDGKCEVLAAPFAVFLNPDDDKTYFEPDLSIICDTSKLDEKGCYGAPDWIIEIVSPSSRPRDYIKKMIKYNMGGVREYWIVDYLQDRIMAYNFEQETVGECTFADKIKIGIFEDFEIDFAEININGSSL